jgi:hypothetical protein
MIEKVNVGGGLASGAEGEELSEERYGMGVVT